MIVTKKSENVMKCCNTTLRQVMEKRLKTGNNFYNRRKQGKFKCVIQCGDIFFRCEADIKKCIDEVGVENIKKYYFRVKD